VLCLKKKEQRDNFNYLSVICFNSLPGTVYSTRDILGCRWFFQANTGLLCQNWPQHLPLM